MGDGAVSMELAGNSSLTQNTSSFTSNSVTATDLGAIQAAQRIAQESALAGSEVARASLAGAFGFGSDAVGLSADALATGGKALTDALDFGGNAMDYASGAFGSALASNGRATSDALGFGQSVSSDALRTAGNAMDAGLSAVLDALGFGRTAMDGVSDAWGDSTAQALGFGRTAMDGALSGVSDAWGDSTAQALGFGRAAMAGVSDAWRYSAASADYSRDQAFGLVDSVVSNAVDVIASRANAESASLRSIYETALGQINGTNARLGDAYADSQGRGALTDKMLMLAIGGAMIVALMAVRKG